MDRTMTTQLHFVLLTFKYRSNYGLLRKTWRRVNLRLPRWVRVTSETLQGLHQYNVSAEGAGIETDKAQAQNTWSCASGTDQDTTSGQQEHWVGLNKRNVFSSIGWKKINVLTVNTEKFWSVFIFSWRSILDIQRFLSEIHTAWCYTVQKSVPRIIGLQRNQTGSGGGKKTQSERYRETATNNNHNNNVT